MKAALSIILRRALSVAAVAAMCLGPQAAEAGCAGSPSGNEGDIIYNSTYHLMQYCNGTSWINMGQAASVTYGTLTTNDFCTATSGSNIQCTTAAINLASQVTGVLPVTNGGTGLSSAAAGSMLYASAANTYSSLAIGTTGYVLTASGGMPTWAAPPATGVTSFSAGTTGLTPATATIGAVVLAGTLVVANGGTGDTALTANVVYKGNGTGGMLASSITDNGMVVTTTENVGIGTTTAGNTLTINGSEGIQFGSDYTSTGNQSDVSFGNVSAVRYNGGAAATFYGITAGSNGQILNLHNASSYTFTLSNQSANESTAANKIVTGSGADLPVAANSSVSLQYDASSAVWRVLGGSTSNVIPVGTISAFAATSCPAGWSPWTPSYGVFLRGIDPTGSTAYDPSGIRAPGNYQADLVGPHTHEILAYNSPNGNTSVAYSGGGSLAPAIPTSTNSGAGSGSETRPKNVAVLFCQYQGGGTYAPNIGALTANDFCTANSSGQITCGTGSTGTGNVALAASPTFSGTITAGSATFSGNVGIGTASTPNALSVNGSISVSPGAAIYLLGQSSFGPSITTGYSNSVLIVESGAAGFQINCQENNCVEVSINNGATSWTSGSDLRLKNVIGLIGDPLEKLSEINGVYFTWKSDGKRTRHIGVIAQDVQKVLPEAVGKNGNTDYLGVRYTELIPLVIEAVKQLKADNDNLRADADKRAAEIDALRAANDNEAAQLAALRADVEKLRTTQK